MKQAYGVSFTIRVCLSQVLFGLVWYATEDDREDRVDPLVVDMPRHIFYPTNPVPRLPEEFEHEGYIEIEAPVVETDTTFFGEATIFQN